MTCREVVEFLMDYLEGELPGPQQDEFERHLGQCPPCAAYLETYRETIRLGKCICQDPEGPVSGAVPEDLVTAILAARKR